jgi:hypothetical protein
LTSQAGSWCSHRAGNEAAEEDGDERGLHVDDFVVWVGSVWSRLLVKYVDVVCR